MAVNWTKLWGPSDDGTVLRGVDIRNIQNDISSTGLTDADSIQGKSVAAPTVGDDGSPLYWNNSADRYEYSPVEDLLTGVNHGDILYYNGTTFVVLPPGTSGYGLESQGIGSPPIWVAPKDKPSDACFSVTASGSVQGNDSAGADVVFTFDTEAFDTGGDFNIGTYAFTVPKTGKYLFSFYGVLENNGLVGTQDIRFGVNGTVSDPAASIVIAALVNTSYTASTILDLTAADTVTVILEKAADVASTCRIEAGARFCGNYLP